jgi:hypothetical protein
VVRGPGNGKTALDTSLEAVMTMDIDAAPAAEVDAEHDHAWRKVPGTHEDMVVGEYRCDLCRKVWSL